MTGIENQILTQVRHISERQRRRLIEEYIEPDPRRPGPGDAQLREAGVHVWAIIGNLPAVSGDLHKAAASYDINPDAVIAALLYYIENREAIDHRLQENRSSAVQVS